MIDYITTIHDGAKAMQEEMAQQSGLTDQQAKDLADAAELLALVEQLLDEATEALNEQPANEAKSNSKKRVAMLLLREAMELIRKALP